jgi:glycosyltransferase involved in cell wall biosynthesis
VSSGETRGRDDHSHSDPGEFELAVRVSGYLSRALGLGAAARGYAQALEAAGVAVSTASVPLHHLSLPEGLDAGYGEHGFQDALHDHPHNNFEILAINADELPDFVDRMGVDYFHGPRIGIWGWETNRIPQRWQRAYELVDEIWVYSRFMAENIGAVASVPVIALPPPVQPPADAVELTRLGVPDDAFMFLFVFDYMSTIQRKNPVGLIEAFRQAFAPGEGPQLLIKTINAPLRPLAEEAVLWAAHGRTDIRVVDRSLSASERDGLMAACDCYVSLHRAEGFGLTLAEAMAIGKPVIGTGYSGNLDFMNNRNSFLVDYELGVVGPDCEIYPADGEWAQPSVEHAAQLIREVVADPQRAVLVGARARDDVARLLSARTTGAAMRKRLERLARGDGLPWPGRRAAPAASNRPTVAGHGGPWGQLTGESEPSPRSRAGSA